MEDTSHRGPGRPLGSKNKLGKDEKAFIQQLLEDTQEQYKKAFMNLANSEKVNDQHRFMAIRQEMSKMVVPRPTELSLTDPNKEIDSITVLFHTWDEDSDDEGSEV